MDFPVTTVIVSALTGAIGGTAAVEGLARLLGDRWLQKTLAKEKAEYERQLAGLKKDFDKELAQYHACIDRSTFVTRAHFETDFTAMKEVSQSLSEVKLIVKDLYPIEVRPANPNRDALLVEWEKASRTFKEKLEEWAVFLEPKLYSEFDHCYAAASAFCREEKSASGAPKEGSKSYFWDSYRAASQMVRDRVQSLAVVPGT